MHLPDAINARTTPWASSDSNFSDSRDYVLAAAHALGNVIRPLLAGEAKNPHGNRRRSSRESPSDDKHAHRDDAHADEFCTAGSHAVGSDGF